MTLFAELKRRNVIRAGMLYAGSVWALAQGIAQLGPLFSAPDWFARVFVIAGVIGFPFWLAFAWFYEWTPAGLKRESEVPADASIVRRTGRKLDVAIIAVLAIAVVLLLTDRFTSHREVDHNGVSAGHAMLRDPRVKAKLAEYGFVAYWREKGWPAGCGPLGEADFECGADAKAN